LPFFLTGDKPTNQVMGTTEQHHGAADVGVAAPLLPSAAVEPAPAAPPRRNMFAFVCATLASMTTILMGYST